MPTPANRATAKQRLLGAASSLRAITNATDANFAGVHDPLSAKQVQSLAVARHRAAPVDRGQPTQLGELENSPQGRGLSIREIHRRFVAALGHALPDLSAQEIDARSYSVIRLVLRVFGDFGETRAPHAKSSRLLGREAFLQSLLEFSTAGIQGSPFPQVNS